MRFSDATLEAALDDAYIVPVIFAEMQFPTTAVHGLWNFTNSAESWFGGEVTLTPNATYLSYTPSGSGNYMQRSSLAVNGRVARFIRMRFRRTGGTTWDGDAFYGTAGHSVVETYKKTIADPTGGVVGNWVIAEWDMWDLAASMVDDWKNNTITSIRLDIGGGVGDNFDIDWIEVGGPYGTLRMHNDLGMLAFDPDYTYRWNFTNTVDGWTAIRGTLTPNATYVNLTDTSANAGLYIDGLSIDGFTYRYLRFRIRRNAVTAFTNYTVQWSTADHVVSSTYQYVSTYDPSVLNDWVIIEYDMWAATNGLDWKSNIITGINLYPMMSGSADVTCDIDWIEVVPGWIGAGSVASIGAIEETEGAAPYAVEIGLSGIDNSILNAAREVEYQDRVARLCLGVRDGITGTLITDPIELVYGLMDQMIITAGKETSSVMLRIESEQVRWTLPALKFYDAATLQSEYAGDEFFNYLEAMKNLQLRWGTNNPNVNLGNNAPNPQVLINNVLRAFF